MPVVRNSPSIQGDVSGPDPARAPPNKAIVMAGLACRGQPAGVSLASQGPPGRAPLPPRAGRAWSTFGPHAIGAERFITVSSGTSSALVSHSILRKQSRVENPDQDAVARARTIVPRTGQLRFLCVGGWGPSASR
jgi:hypothetical protein